MEGQVAIDALFGEFSHLRDLDVFDSQDPVKLTRTQKKEALRAINLIKEKCCGKIKGRTVANGKQERDLYYTKQEEEMSSPTTISRDALVLVAPSCSACRTSAKTVASGHGQL
jgi:hypothetical protein